MFNLRSFRKNLKQKLANVVFYSQSRLGSTNHSDCTKDEAGDVYVVKTIQFLFFPTHT